MANAVCSYVLTNNYGATINAKIENLQYGANSYDQFIFRLYRWSGSAWVYQTSYTAYGYDYGSSNWADHDFTNQQPNYSYYVSVWADYGSTWYPDDPGFGTGFVSSWITADIPVASFASVCATQTSVTFSRSNTVGYMKTYVYEDSAWVDIASSSYYYSVSGNDVTITNLPPNYSVYAYVATYLKMSGGSSYSTYASTAPSSSPYYLTFTTSNWSTPTAPTMSYRINGGFALSWTDNGFDSYVAIDTGSGYVEYDAGYTNTDWKINLYVYGVQCSIKAKNVYTAWDGNTYSGNYSSVNIGTTTSQIPGIFDAYAVGTTVTIWIGAMSGNYSYFKIWYKATDSGTWLSKQVYTTGRHDVTGLTNGKTYDFKVSSFYTIAGTDVESVDDNGYVGYSSTEQFAITSRPTNWAWTTVITAGTNVPSVSGKTIYIMPASEWNNFTAKINEFRTYKSLTSYSFTSVSTNTEFTKTIINQALVAIRAMSAHFTWGGTFPPDRVTGDNILQASVYQNMRDAMNSIT